ncbi:MCE family protein [Nocardioides carbamazepini]|uniref:MlaD family protein n=1 Tax=Nocardioides carbamazepini TaxID=2854259 RepID=UPI002149D513|nr:MlaD family protein [Nocardioides carbamazepini]MCR1785751.1 MCE family protein [Nocardioides carbamazepini]
MSRRLRRFWERARSEPGLGKNLIAVGVLVALGTTVAGYFLAHQRFNPPWEDRYTVYAVLDEAAGVSPGNGQEVRIAGVQVGDIRSAEVGPDGQARLELRIDSGQEVHEDARLLLRPKSPLNDMYVEISPGTADAPLLGDGDTIPLGRTVSPVQVDDVLANLDRHTQDALSSLFAESDVALVNAPDTLPPGLEQADLLMQDLQPVLRRLETRRENLAQLVHSLAQVSAAAGHNDARLQRMATSLGQTLSTLAGSRAGLDGTLAQLPELSADLRTTTRSVAALADQLDPTLADVRAASDELPGALKSFNSSIDELDGFVRKAGPVLEHAQPVVGDLRAAAPDVRRIAGDLRPLSADAQPLTADLVTHLDDVSAFVYNTNSVASLRDANRGILRGLLTISPETLGGLLP